MMWFAKFTPSFLTAENSVYIQDWNMCINRYEITQMDALEKTLHSRTMNEHYL